MHFPFLPVAVNIEKIPNNKFLRFMILFPWPNIGSSLYRLPKELWTCRNITVGSHSQGLTRSLHRIGCWRRHFHNLIPVPSSRQSYKHSSFNRELILFLVFIPSGYTIYCLPLELHWYSLTSGYRINRGTDPEHLSFSYNRVYSLLSHNFPVSCLPATTLWIVSFFFLFHSLTHS